MLRNWGWLMAMTCLSSRPTARLAKVAISDGIVPGVALCRCNLGIEPLSVLFAERAGRLPQVSDL